MHTALAILALIGFAAAQTSCSCEQNPGGLCSKIVDDGDGTCSLVSSNCGGCACVSGGSLTCDLATQTAVQFDNFPAVDTCSVVPIQVAVCPTGPPGPAVRQCCISGENVYSGECAFGPLPAGVVTSIDYTLSSTTTGNVTALADGSDRDITVGLGVSGTPLPPSTVDLAQGSSYGDDLVTVSVPAGTTPAISLASTVSYTFTGLTSGPEFNALTTETSQIIQITPNFIESSGETENSASTNEVCLSVTYNF